MDSSSPLLPAGVDTMAWGDRRIRLLEAVCERGRVLRSAAAFLVVQPSGGDWQFGPFAALDCSSAGTLLDAALDDIPRGGVLYLDVPCSNRAAGRMLRRRGLREVGSAELMYAGARPAYKGEYLYGLATMGSCG